MIKLGKPYIEGNYVPIGYTIVIPYTIEPPIIEMSEKNQEQWIKKWEKYLDEQQKGIGQELIRMSKKTYSYETSSWIGTATFRFDGGIDNFEKHVHRIRILVDYVNNQVQAMIEIEEEQRTRIQERLNAAWA